MFDHVGACHRESDALRREFEGSKNSTHRVENLGNRAMIPWIVFDRDQVKDFDDNVLDSLIDNLCGKW